MARPKKEEIDSSLAVEEQKPRGPIPVKVVAQEAPVYSNPHNFPHEKDEVEKRRYKFSYNQQPGSWLEFSKGRTVIKGNGMPGTVMEKYYFEDGNEYDIPVDVAKHLNALIYFEGGRQRARCVCVEV